LIQRREQEATLFKPRLNSQSRKKYKSKWNEAVKRSLSWYE